MIDPSTQPKRYFGFYPDVTKFGLGELDILRNPKAHAAFVKQFSCYNYGASPEIKVLPGGATQVTKWRTLGRISHEMTIVMPDNKTVYAADDHPNGGEGGSEVVDDGEADLR